MQIAITLVLALTNSGPTAEESHRPLTSVARRGEFVFASTSNGLFRASLRTKVWERLATPASMPFDGTFAARSDDTPQLAYIAGPKPLEVNSKPSDGRRRGLYVSDDFGVTWRLILERDDLAPPCIIPTARSS